MLLSKKMIIGMVHLKNISYNINDDFELEKVLTTAKRDLISLQEGGVDAAIVENFFDIPYSNEISLEQVINFTSIFTRLKEISSIPLGVNLQQTSGNEEMQIAQLCGGEFIRSEAFVETRLGSFGILTPQANSLIKYKKERNSKVVIFADINVKHTIGLVNQPIESSILDAKMAGANALILTGFATGKSPTVEDVRRFKEIAEEIPVLVGSGVSKNNISELMKHCEGIIVGSSLKENGEVSNEIDVNKVKEIVELGREVTN